MRLTTLLPPPPNTDNFYINDGIFNLIGYFIQQRHLLKKYLVLDYHNLCALNRSKALNIIIPRILIRQKRIKC